MTLNLTVLVQMLNFCVAWWVLQRLFWQPALAALHKSDAHQEALKKKLEKSKQLLHDAEEGLNGERRESLHLYAHRRPSASSHLLAAREFSVRSSRDADEFAQLVQKASSSKKRAAVPSFSSTVESVKKRIIKRVTHGG